VFVLLVRVCIGTFVVCVFGLLFGVVRGCCSLVGLLGSDDELRDCLGCDCVCA